MTDDGETTRVNFIQRVLRCVPIRVLNVEVDDVACGDAPPDERKMVIAAYQIILVDEHIFIAQSCSSCLDEVHKPRRGTLLALDVRITLDFQI